MRIGFIPGPLDTLSGEHFPHLVHMQDNLKALRKKTEIELIMAEKANNKYLKFCKTRAFSILNRKHMHVLRKLFHLAFFLAVYMEVKKRVKNQQNDVFIVRFSFANYLIARYLHSKSHKLLLEVHALAHVEEREFGQTYAPMFFILMIRYLEKKMLALAHQIITVSGSLRMSLASLGVDSARIQAVHNAVDPELFDYTTNPVDVIRRHNLENKTVVGFVGSFARYHGVRLLLKVAENFQKQDQNAHFLIVGKNVHGTDNIVEEVVASELAPMFTFSGEVPHAMIPSYIAAMDIAMIPDFNNYGSPMKLFEYMAMKKAIVAPKVAPIREVIENGKTGILFERGNVMEAVKGIEMLIKDERLRRDLGQRAYVEVMSYHTWDQNAKRIVQIAELMLCQSSLLCDRLV